MINDIMPRISAAQTGDKILYYTGYLFNDIFPDYQKGDTAEEKKEKKDKAGEIAFLAEEMYKLFYQGRITLLQSKLGDFKYQYFAAVLDPKGMLKRHKYNQDIALRPKRINLRYAK